LKVKGQDVGLVWKLPARLTDQQTPDIKYIDFTKTRWKTDIGTSEVGAV
jgi:hypothetical protein